MDHVPDAITVTTASRRKGCTRKHIYDALDRGDLNEVRVAGRRFVREDDTFARYTVREFGGRLHEDYRT